MLKKTRIARNRLVPLALAQDVAELLKRASDELSLGPQVWCEEAV